MVATRRTAVLLSLLLPVSVAFADDAPRVEAGGRAAFSGLFGEHMVLQRDAPISLWGSASPGERLTVAFAGHSREAAADGTGRWQVLLPAMPAGGPHRLRLRSGGDVVQEIRDVLVGDLWLCSGQSNMEFPVSRASNGSHGPESAVPEVRLATIRHDSAVTPRTEFRTLPDWRVADREAVQDFSAVCWFFAQALHEAHGVPLGLVHASWGGSRIEAWLDDGALREVGGFGDRLGLLDAYADDREVGSERFATVWTDWWRSVSAGEPDPWRAGDAQEWRPVPGALRDWKAWGEPSLAAHNGMVWFRQSFELDDRQAKADAVLSLGGVDEVDLTWVNGTFIGTQFGWGTERRYAVPSALLRPGSNTVTVNVLSTWGSGGLVGPGERMALELADGGTVALGDGWHYRRVPPETGSPPSAPWQSINGLTGLSNAMIAPLGELPMTGALWYQGESNAGDAASYERLLAALAADWRGRFGESLAFVIVQLPNFGAPPTEPVDSGWAQLRDAQRRVAEADPRAGLVVTVDTGDDRDLHPPNKAIVGRRAADVAGVLAYGATGIVDGIGPLRAFRQGDRVALEFSPADETLVVAGDDTPVAFELCEETGCAYADAALEGNRVLLSGATGAERVRHCWADAPVCNLYGASGLPVSSFEIPIEER